MRKPFSALYIHIPFCKSRCHYCDFCSEAINKSDERIDEYIEDIVMQVFKLGREGELANIETIYIGGGTPSFIGSKRLTSLLYAIGLSINLTDDIEVTVECNPDSLDERLVKDMFALGVNRVSVGVQSFDDDLLESIGRAHDSKDAIKAIECAKTRFDNMSIDLMCGLPGQTMNVFEESLKQAIALDIPHISVYPLTVEVGTRMYELVKAGEIELPDEDEIANMMELAADILTDAGFEHYEVSNFAKPGYQSRHNKSYWQGKPYLGLGKSAVSMQEDEKGRIRTKDGEIDDELTPHQAKCENLILAMRTSDGVCIDEIESLNNTGFARILDKFEQLEKQGLVEKANERFVPTLKGLLLGNEIYESILDFF